MNGVPFLPPLPLLEFALAFGLYNLLCLTVYAALRWCGGRFHRALCVFGSLSLALWLLIYGRDTGLPGLDPYGSRSHIFDLLSGGIILLATLCGGGALIGAATQKQLLYWHGVLFTALYFLLVQSVVYFIIFTPFFVSDFYNEYLLAVAEDRLYIAVGLKPFQQNPYVQIVFPLLIWSYPLVLPAGEILVRSLYRAYQQNKTGSFA